MAKKIMLQIRMTQFLAVSLAGNLQFCTRNQNLISLSWRLTLNSTE